MSAARRSHSFPLLDTEPGRFQAALDAHGCAVTRTRPSVIQINLGKRCNQACRHCHVDAGPARTERMDADTLVAVRAVIRRENIGTVDITGGAPEMHPDFTALVADLRDDGRQVIVRTNLTIMEQPGYTRLPEFYAAHKVQLIASLPCYLEANVEAQRGRGVFAASIRVLRSLNACGYGRGDGALALNLVFNPQGAVLPPAQATLEADYRRELGERYGIRFTRLLTITNMPLGRFAGDLARERALDAYRTLLEDHFNPATVAALMCRHTINVGWDGALYDCDFNAMLGLPLRGAQGAPLTIRDVAAGRGVGSDIALGSHCFGCTAGAGSSCGGALT